MNNPIQQRFQITTIDRKPALFDAELQTIAWLPDSHFNYLEVDGVGIIGVIDTKTGREIPLNWIPVNDVSKPF
jgi:hypothetical protein